MLLKLYYDEYSFSWHLEHRLNGMQELAHYWEKEFDWRKAEARINSFANYEMRVNGIEVDCPFCL